MAVKASILQPDRWLAQKSGEAIKKAWLKFRAGAPLTEDQIARIVSIQAVTSSSYEYVVSNLVESPDGSFSIRPEKPSVSLTKKVADSTPQEFPEFEVTVNSQTLIVWSPISSAERSRRANLRSSESLLSATDGLLVSREPIANSKGVGQFIPITLDGASIERRSELFTVIAERLGENFDVYGYSDTPPSAGVIAIEVGEKEKAPRYYDAEKWVLAKSRKPEEAEDFAVKDGRSVVDHQPHSNTVIVARLDPFVKDIRDRVADTAGVSPWEVELTVSMVVDESTEQGRINSVDVVRFDKNISVSKDKRAEFFANFIYLIPGGSSGWRVREDKTNGRFSLLYGKALALDEKILLPFDEVLSGGWGDIEVGRKATGKPMILHLADNPHSIVAGKTNSGKSITLAIIIAIWMAKGGKLAVIDPTKRGLDFKWVRPWVDDRFWGGHKDIEVALAALRAVYDEVQRRADILESRNVPKRTRLTPEQIVEFDMPPLLAVFDEFASSVTLAAVPPGLPKDDPERVEAETLNANKSRLLSLTGKILREARFTGIHMAIGTQVWSTELIGKGSGEMRTNAGNRLQIGGANATALSMIVEDLEDAKKAYEIAHKVAVSDSKYDDEADRTAIPGRGIAEINGGGTHAIHGYFVEDEQELADWLTRLAIAQPLHNTVINYGGTPVPRSAVPKPSQNVFNIWDFQKGERGTQLSTPATVQQPPHKFPGDPAATERTSE